MNILADRPFMIFKKIGEYGAMYSLGISNKKENGSYETAYMNVKFKKDVNLEDKTKIIIKKGWLKFRLKDKKPYWYIFISEFQNLDNMTNSEIVKTVLETPSDPFEEFSKEIIDDDLPFGD